MNSPHALHSVQKINIAMRGRPTASAAVLLVSRTKYLCGVVVRSSAESSTHRSATGANLRHQRGPKRFGGGIDGGGGGGLVNDDYVNYRHSSDPAGPGADDDIDPAQHAILHRQGQHRSATERRSSSADRAAGSPSVNGFRSSAPAPSWCAVSPPTLRTFAVAIVAVAVGQRTSVDVYCFSTAILAVLSAVIDWSVEMIRWRTSVVDRFRRRRSVIDIVSCKFPVKSTSRTRI